MRVFSDAIMFVDPDLRYEYRLFMTFILSNLLLNMV